MSKSYLEKTEKHFKKAEQWLDGIAPTPLRQSLDACAVHAINIINNFDVDRYEEDEGYADRWDKYRDMINALLTYDDLPG